MTEKLIQEILAPLPAKMALISEGILLGPVRMMELGGVMRFCVEVGTVNVACDHTSEMIQIQYQKLQVTSCVCSVV